VAGRSKARRWADDDSDAEATYMTPYLDAVRREPLPVMTSTLPRPAMPVHASSVRARTHPRFWGRDVMDARRLGPGRRRRGHDRPWPHLVHSLLVRPLDGRTPVHQHLGRRGRVSAPDDGGWREILPRQETQPATATVELRHMQLPQDQ
jgi:hypothetical protein